MLQQVIQAVDYQSARETDEIVCKELLVHKQRSQAMSSYHSWPESFKQIAQAMKIENILCTSMIAKKSEEETCLKIRDSLFDK